MVDGASCADEKVMQLLEAVLKELEEGRAIYIHCYGGHGRSGIVACALLCLLLAVPPDEAVGIFNQLHSFRVEPLDRSSKSCRAQVWGGRTGAIPSQRHAVGTAPCLAAERLACAAEAAS